MTNNFQQVREFKIYRRQKKNKDAHKRLRLIDSSLYGKKQHVKLNNKNKH